MHVFLHGMEKEAGVVLGSPPGWMSLALMNINRSVQGYLADRAIVLIGDRFGKSNA